MLTDSEEIERRRVEDPSMRSSRGCVQRVRIAPLAEHGTLNIDEGVMESLRTLAVMDIGLTDGQRCHTSQREDSRGNETEEEEGVLDVDGHTPQLDMDDGHSQY